jgi:hypothetical protein
VNPICAAVCRQISSIAGVASGLRGSSFIARDSSRPRALRGIAAI